MRFLTATALLLALSAPAVAAQRPQVRDGFWIGFGFGGGSADITCDGCPNADREMGATGFVKLGGTLNDRVLLGGEINVWTKEDQGVTTGLGNTSFAVYFYPRPAGGLFVRGGIGYALVFVDGPLVEADGSGFGFVLGGGYDIRVGRNLSITPVVNFFLGSDGDLKENGSVIDQGVKHNVFEIGLGLTFH